MHYARLALFASLILALALPAGAEPQPGQSFTGKVVAVTAGDTYEVDRPGGPVVTVRLCGVDGPETGQPYGQRATMAARRYVGGKSVQVTVKDIGRYGRPWQGLPCRAALSVISPRRHPPSRPIRH